MSKTQQIEPLPPVVQRFLRYAAIDTQSVEGVEDYPSSTSQKDLAHVLVEELEDLGLTDVRMDEWGCVTATLPASPGVKAPVIGLIAHLDTSPEVSGANVKTIIHSNYKGDPVVLPAGNITISPEDSPHLKECVGHDIITANGTTLLGADDKAGIAEIITAIEQLQENPEFKHGPVRLAFTCDEEVGKGTLHFDVEAFGADYAYTIDGETVGQIENETFCADMATVTVTGVNIHPGYAKNKLINALKGAAQILLELPADEAPETTEARQGYLHAVSLEGGVEEATIKILVRDFEEAGLKRLETILDQVVVRVRKQFPGLAIDVALQEQYRNMRQHLDNTPESVEVAMEAVRRAGGEPKLSYARGGTDGAMLTYKGLPTPNFFAGGHEFHSKREWISIQDMQFTVKALVTMLQLWSERPA